MPLKIMILGANGFIGSALTNAILRTRPWEVYGIDLSDNKLKIEVFPNSQLGTQAGMVTHDLPELTAPVTLLMTSADTVLIGEPRGAPGSATETRFVSFKLEPVLGPTAIASLAVRGFDGRALWRDGDTVYASTASGGRAVFCTVWTRGRLIVVLSGVSGIRSTSAVAPLL